eukprot:COSAG01_NODE_18225_length_1091_cov_2.606855_2_plen_88_part_00
MYWLHQQLDPLIAARHIPACEALLRPPGHGADDHSSVTEGLARLCAGFRYPLGIGSRLTEIYLCRACSWQARLRMDSVSLLESVEID